MTKLLPQPGRAYAFCYPRYNYLGLPEKMECRRLLVTEVRDIRRQPLDPFTEKNNPQLRRGRFLVTGQDLDKGEKRSFYAESMADVHQVDPDEQIVAAAEYVVVDGLRVAYRAGTIGEAMAYVLGACRGVICGVLGRKFA